MNYSSNNLIEIEHEVQESIEVMDEYTVFKELVISNTDPNKSG